MPVLAGVGAATGRQAATIAASAADSGADELLVLSPPHVADPRRYFETVAAAADLPVLAYHYPAASPPGLPMALLPELPVAGVKDSSGDAERLLDELADHDGAVYTGAATLLTMAAQIGATSAILALANAEPELCAAAFAGDRDAQIALLTAHRAAAAEFPAGIKRLTADRWRTSKTARTGT